MDRNAEGQFAPFFGLTGPAGRQPKYGLYMASATEMALSFNSVKIASFLAAGGMQRLIHTGNVGAIAGTSGTDTTPVVTETYFAELFVPVGCTLTGVALLNGTAAAGNITAGLFTSAGAAIAAAKTASTAQSGTDVYQRIPFAAPYFAASGVYLLGFQFDNTSARFRTHAVGSFGAAKKTGEVYGTFTTLTPPTTFTTAVGPIASVY